MPTINNTRYDVVIVGAGMVGASLACTLEQASGNIPLKILIVEARTIAAQQAVLQPSFDSRSTVLSFGSVEYFQRLGLWEKLTESAEAIKKIHVSDQGKFGTVRIDSHAYNVDALGYVVENRVIGEELNKALLKAKKIDLLSPVKVNEIIPGSEFVRLELGEGNKNSTVQTKLVVLAEGGRSGLCEKLGIHRNSESYEQAAIIATVAFSEPHYNIAYERFTPKGPMAILPLADVDGSHRAALVWTQSSANVDEVMALDETAFLKALGEDFGTRVGKFTKVGKRASYPLSLQQAEEQVRSGLVLLGNVAHTLHPVAGQGFNLALRDAMRLAEVIINAVKKNRNPGSIKNLQSYLNKTQSDQDKTIAFSHYMTKLFSTNNGALIWARKFGLLSIDLLPEVKKNLSRQAMGMSERLVNL